ncbi:Endonuclease/Exonuclease/phosphatase family protein [Lacunisphaera limnophila]|uniref:Endonuclease/Exonuclease/phosphatase family protein n=1 Tax=Lacunisphaera limnophila TaxID=1838286 RepID=A0A1D8AYV0_9BACT|nr:endonuclease/exonuclease/phosphatase family protein [Lacunisphaera limnophila]AOS46083.1 Endonuclease/Exonuclease/phosphatase family protein [Lacunisphaera limnophila]
MKIGLWNIDHPTTNSGSQTKEDRFLAIAQYLTVADCDIYIILEANSAMSLPGYFSEFSDESPFKPLHRYYGEPNKYHQVAIYSKTPIQLLEVTEPINGLLCQVTSPFGPLTLYGNVITIKDRWVKGSKMTYTARLSEQLEAIEKVPKNMTLIGGDFNFRLGVPRWLSPHQQMLSQSLKQGLMWPTQEREDTVQHVMHTNDLTARVSLDFSIRHSATGEKRLSDHPYMGIDLNSV